MYFPAPEGRSQLHKKVAAAAAAFHHCLYKLAAMGRILSDQFMHLKKKKVTLTATLFLNAAQTGTVLLSERLARLTCGKSFLHQRHAVAASHQLHVQTRQ